MKHTSTQERGYAMLSLLVGMTVGLIVLLSMAAKPSAQFVGQRENEEEMFFRSQQLSFAIQTYAMLKGGLAPQNLPTKLEDLLNEFNVQGRTLHILRRSSLTDPLTGKEWKAIRLGDPLIREFYRTYMKAMVEQQAMALSAGGAAAGLQQQQMPPLLIMAAQAAGINVASPNPNEEEKEGEASSSASGFSSGFALDSDSDSRPIIGVVSTFKKPLIRNYFGIGSYEKALMIAGVQAPGMMTGLPLGGGQGVSAPPTTAPATGEPDYAPKLQGGQCPPGSTDPKCPRNWGLGNKQQP